MPSQLSDNQNACWSDTLQLCVSLIKASRLYISLRLLASKYDASTIARAVLSRVMSSL
jgi:hypothetical protein